MKTGLIYHSIFKEHYTGVSHPECAERCDAAVAGFEDACACDCTLRLDARPADESEIALCHAPHYIDVVKEDVVEGFTSLRTGDTNISARSFDAALMAAGGTMSAVDAVMTGKAQNAFCVVRPPGHHATPDRGMGFCIFNNVAVGARYAQKKYGLERVAVIDWDIHHGNGTQEIFDEDPSVFYFSAHQWPNYPGTGTRHQTGLGKGAGYSLNCPSAPGSGRREIVGFFRHELQPAMAKFRPELIMISAGFDGWVGDPIGAFELRPADYAELTAIVMDLGRKYAQGRIVSVLEGGYDLQGLRSCVAAHVGELAQVS